MYATLAFQYDFFNQGGTQLASQMHQTFKLIVGVCDAVFYILNRKPA